MPSTLLALFFIAVVLAIVWIGAGMILRRWEGSRWHRRWRARIHEEWERADRIVRDDSAANPDERDEPDEADDADIR